MQRRRTTSTALIATAVGGALLLTACTGTPAGDDGGGEGSQSITYLIEEPEDAETLQALEDHIGEFADRAGIDVEVDTLPLDAMRTVLQTQLRSGDGPDVFGWGSGPGFGGALAQAGLVMDLTEAYETYDWQVFESAKERVTFDGKVYGVPGELETTGIFYNKDMFAGLGLDEPQSLGDLQAASREIAAAGTIPMAVGDKEGWEGGHLLSMALSSAIGSDGMEALLAGEASWDSPEVVAALEVWRDANADGFLPASPTSVDYDGSLALYYSGDAAMVPTGSWLVSEIDNNTDFETGYIPFPAPDGPGVFAGGLGSGPYVSALTRKTDAALQLVDFLASPEHGAWVVENLTAIPPVEVDTTGLDVSPLFTQVLEDTAALADGGPDSGAGSSDGSGDIGYNIDVLMSDAFNEAMYDGVQAVLTGQQSPEDVAADLQTASQE